MIKLNLKNKIQEARNNLILAIEKNPEHWEVDSNIYQGNLTIRLMFETRSDQINPSQLVLFHPGHHGKCTPFDIAMMVESRFINENQSITPNVQDIYQNVSKGLSSVNEDLISAVTELKKYLKILNEKVFHNPSVDLLSIAYEMDLKGAKFSDVVDIKKDIISLSKMALMVNTDEDGECNLDRVKHLVDSITSKQGQRKIIKEYPQTAASIKKVNKLLNMEKSLEMSM